MGVETGKKERTPVRRRWRLLSILAIANLVAVGVVAVPSHAQVTSCQATIANTTVLGSLVVPAGQACELINVTVTAGAEVQAGADLLMESSTIRGALTAATDAYVQASDTRVGGLVTLTQAFGLLSESSRFDRTVDARDSGFVYSTDSTHWGGLLSINGETVIEQGFVLGSLRTEQDRLTDIFDSVVFGKVTVIAADQGSVVCQAGIAIGMTIQDSSGIIQIGDDGWASNCAFNVLGNLTVVDNIGADIQITSNLIAGDLLCSGNDPAPHGSFNVVGGQASGQCASLSPAPEAASPMSTTEMTDTAPRSAHIQALIAQRLAG